MGLHKKLILYPPGGKNFVYAKDVAQSIINAITHAKTVKNTSPAMRI